MQKLLFLIAHSAFALSFFHPVAAQDAPTGACVLSSGQWCLPPSRGLPGSTCACLTDSGWLEGTQK